MGRRSANEGSIYKRKKDRLWVAQYLVDTPEGKTKRKYIYGKKRKDVANKLAEVKKERGEGLLLDAGSMTVAEFLADWLESEKESVRESTHNRREEVVRLHVNPCIGSTKLTKLNALHVQRLYARKLDEGLSPGTVRLIHANLSKALSKGVRWRLMSVNVARAATAPKNNAEEVKPLTREEVRRLLDAARGDRFECLYTLAVTTGMRRGELLGLRYEDIDLKRGTLQVRRSLSKGKVNLPKTSKSRRSIKLSRIAIEALKRHKKRQTVLSEWVFCTFRGMPISSQSLLWKAWEDIRERAGLPEGTHLHQLRHTCATLLLQENVHPKLVSSLLGHSTIKQTLDTYSHVLDNMLGSVADGMDEALG
jgi:integrase